MRKTLGLTIIAAMLAVELSIGWNLFRDKGEDSLWGAGKKDVTAIMASGKYIVPKQGSRNSLEYKIVEILQGAAGDKIWARQQALEIALKALDLSHWLELSSLRYEFNFVDIHPASGKELVISVSAGKDNGLVAVFSPGAKGYELIGALTDLVPVTHVGVIGLPGLDYKALVIDEYLDEMTGAFFKVKTKSVYIFKGEALEKVWERDRYRKEYWPEGGQLKGDQTSWLMRKEEAAIVFRPEGKIEVTGIRTQGRSKNLGDLAGEYEITKKEKNKEVYIWNAEKRAFVLQ